MGLYKGSRKKVIFFDGRGQRSIAREEGGREGGRDKKFKPEKIYWENNILIFCAPCLKSWVDEVGSGEEHFLELCNFGSGWVGIC